MADIVDRAREFYTNARTGEWILDTEEAEIVKGLVDELERFRVMVGEVRDYAIAASNTATPGEYGNGIQATAEAVLDFLPY